MSIPHAESGDVIDIRPLRENLRDAKTYTLAKTSRMEILRLVLPKGKKLPEHPAPDEITVQCLEGEVRFSVGESSVVLSEGSMLYLTKAVPHAVEALEDSSLLVTLLLK